MSTTTEETQSSPTTTSRASGTAATSCAAPAHPHLLVRWFVQFNPMFTASALCVLGGVLLLAKAMGDGATVALTGVLELYQWLLIGVAALLYRRLLERRPAVILGVIELALLIDPTLQLSALATAGEHNATIAWLVCFAAKIHALAWAFRLRTSLSARWLPIGAAAVVALIPGVRVADVVDASSLRFILAGAVFVLAWCAFTFEPIVQSKLALSEHGRMMFPRLMTAAAWMSIGGFVYQACNASFAEGLLTLLPSVGAVLFAVAAKQKSDAVWAPLFVGGMLCIIGGGSPQAGAALALPLAFIALSLAARASAPRVLVAAVLSGYTIVIGALHDALWSRIELFDAWLVLAILAVPALVAIAPLVWALVRRAAWSALLGIGVVVAATLRLSGVDATPHGPGQWGALLLASGFVLLPLGVVVHRKLQRMLDAASTAAEVDASLATTPSSNETIATAPSTSATVPLR